MGMGMGMGMLRSLAAKCQAVGDGSGGASLRKLFSGIERFAVKTGDKVKVHEDGTIEVG